MQALVFVLLALSVITATTSYSLPRCSNATAPIDFTISDFHSFYPSTENTEHPHSISFKFADSLTNGQSICSSSNLTYPNDGIPCGGIPVYFGWNGTENSGGGFLFIEQTYCYDHIGGEYEENALEGEVYLATDCIPSEPPMPLGYGTLCQSPTVSETGQFSRMSIH